MADLWQQFHGLPKAIRDGVATPTAIAAVDELEQQHPGVELASFVMRAVVHEFPFSELAGKISTESGIDAATAKSITERLQQDVFTGVVADYLGLGKAPVSQPLPTNPVPIPKSPVNLPMVAPVSSVAVVPPSALPPIEKLQPLKTTPVAIPTPVKSPAPIVPVVPMVKPAPLVVPPAVVTPMPQPTSPVGVTAPTTQYSDDDAVEIAKQASKLRSLTNVNPNQDLDSLASQILTEQNLASSDELLQRRSISIIKSRLKGVRTTDEITEMLSRDPKVGGLGLDHEISLTVAAAAEKYATTLKDRGMVRAPEQPAPPTIPAIPTITQQRPTPMPPLHRDEQPMAPVQVQNFTETARASRPVVRPTDIPVVAPLPTPVVAMKSQPTPATVIQRPRGTDRPTVADVVRPQVALGPAEELRSMTLIEFRRLGQGAGDAARKLLDKFQHLQRESFAVWAEAVAGWRQSSVYQLYLTMGRESLETGQPITQIIADRGKNGQPYLSEHEFTVVSDLNRQLQL